MPLGQCIAQHTHREYLTWQEWLDAEWSRPDRHDHYLMLIAQILCQVNSKNPKKIKLEDFKMAFKKQSAPGPISEEERRQRESDQMLAVWLSRLGVSRADVEKR
jgi:hypothetical protein